MYAISLASGKVDIQREQSATYNCYTSIATFQCLFKPSRLLHSPFDYCYCPWRSIHVYNDNQHSMHILRLLDFLSSQPREVCSGLQQAVILNVCKIPSIVWFADWPCISMGCLLLTNDIPSPKVSPSVSQLFVELRTQAQSQVPHHCQRRS